MMKWILGLIRLVLAGLIFLMGYFLGRSTKADQLAATVVTDTLTVRDTVNIPLENPEVQNHHIRYEVSANASVRIRYRINGVEFEDWAGANHWSYEFKARKNQEVDLTAKLARNGRGTIAVRILRDGELLYWSQKDKVRYAEVQAKGKL